jgi:hypothetical protein
MGEPHLNAAELSCSAAKLAQTKVLQLRMDEDRRLSKLEPVEPSQSGLTLMV